MCLSCASCCNVHRYQVVFRNMASEHDGDAQDDQHPTLREGPQFHITDSGLRSIAEMAHEKGTGVCWWIVCLRCLVYDQLVNTMLCCAGARGLRAVVERMLLEPMFDVPGHQPPVNAVVMDETAVRGDAGVVLVTGDQTLEGWLAANEQGLPDAAADAQEFPQSTVG